MRKFNVGDRVLAIVKGSYNVIGRISKVNEKTNRYTVTVESYDQQLYGYIPRILTQPKFTLGPDKIFLCNRQY